MRSELAALLIDIVGSVKQTRRMGMKKLAQLDLAAVMRQVFERSGLSMYAVAKLSGLDRAQVVRFFSGQRSLTLDSASRICTVLGLELRPVKRKREAQVR